MRNRYQLLRLAVALQLVIGAVPFSSALAQCADPVEDCIADCREQKKHCTLLRKTLQAWLKAFCEFEFEEENFECVDTKLDDDGDCDVLCGDEQKDCTKASKADFKDCLKEVKDIRKFCKTDIRFEVDDFKQVCKDDDAACKAACM